MKKFVMSDEERTALMESVAWEKEGFSYAPAVEAAVVEEATAAPEAEVVEEEAEYNICPLCECHLEEELSEERISEHLDFVLDLLSEGAEEDTDSEELAEESDE